MQKYAALLMISILVGVSPTLANSPQDKLIVLQRVLTSEKKDNAKYRAAEKETASLLKTLQDQLITQTATLQATERQVMALQDKQAATTQAISALDHELTQQHVKLAQLLMAAQRLQRVPPEAMLLRPSEPIDAARTKLLLQAATPDIAVQASAIKADLARLAQLKQDLDARGKTLTALQETQRRQQSKLNKNIAARQTALVATTAKTEASDANVTRLSQEAADLKAMLADLARRPPPPLKAMKPVSPTADHDDSDSTDEPEDAEKHSWGQSLLAFFKGSGPSRLPVTGQIRTGYDEKLASGARSQGISIAGVPDGVVIAPESGTVRFAGPFRQYRLLVIIEHAGGYHSLLGGLHDVYITVGSKVAAGEPVGTLEGDAAHANLYYEVRHNGKPVDPRRG